VAVESTNTDGRKLWVAAKGLVVPQNANPSIFGRIWDRWLGDAVFALSSAGISFLGAILGFQRTGYVGWIIAGIAACALLIAAVPVIRHIRDTARQSELDNQIERVVEAKAREFYAFNSVVTPSIRRIAKLAASKTNGIDETKEYSTILTTVLESAARLTGGDGEVRAVFFRKADGNRNRKLEQADYAGSREPSGRVFTDSGRDPAGRAAWNALDRGKVRTWSNLDVNTPDGWADAVRRKPQSRPYKTFSMAPVQGPDRVVYGMLNVVALKPDSFDDLDEERLAALAAILGAAVHLVTARQAHVSHDVGR
jgi:hypothetical protein